METLFSYVETDSRNRRRLVLLILAVSTLITIGAVALLGLREYRTRADREVELFREDVAAGRYDAIYERTSSIFQRQYSEGQFTRRLAAVREAMQACGPPKLGAQFANFSTSGTSVRLQYLRSCATGELRETFTFISSGNGLRLARYDVSQGFR